MSEAGGSVHRSGIVRAFRKIEERFLLAVTLALAAVVMACLALSTLPAWLAVWLRTPGFSQALLALAQLLTRIGERTCGFLESIQFRRIWLKDPEEYRALRARLDVKSYWRR